MHADKLTSLEAGHLGMRAFEVPSAVFRIIIYLEHSMALMVKPKKNSGARAEFLALICFILEPEPSFLALNF